MAKTSSVIDLACQIARSKKITLEDGIVVLPGTPSKRPNHVVGDSLEAKQKYILKYIKWLDKFTQDSYSQIGNSEPSTLIEEFVKYIEKNELCDIPHLQLLIMLINWPNSNHIIDRALKSDCDPKDVVNYDWFLDDKLYGSILTDVNNLLFVPFIIEFMKQCKDPERAFLPFDHEKYNDHNTIPEDIGYVCEKYNEFSKSDICDDELFGRILKFALAIALDETRKWARTSIVYQYINQAYNNHFMRWSGRTNATLAVERLNNIQNKLLKIFDPNCNPGCAIILVIEDILKKKELNPLERCKLLLAKVRAIINVTAPFCVREKAVDAIVRLPYPLPHFDTALKSLQTSKNAYAIEKIFNAANGNLALNYPKGSNNYDVWECIMKSMSKIPYNLPNYYHILEAITWVTKYNVDFPLSFAIEVDGLITTEIAANEKQPYGEKKTYDQRYAIRFFCYRYIAQGINEHDQVFLPDNPSLKGKIFSIIGEIPLDSYYNVYYVYRLCKAYNVITDKMPGDDLVAKNEKFLELLRRAAIVEKDTQIETPVYLKGTGGIDDLFGKVCPQKEKAEKLLVNPRIAKDATYYPL